MPKRYAIRSVNRPNSLSIVSPGDFESEPTVSISLEEVVRDPKFSLYCFDRERRSAWFTESKDPAAELNAPFFYQGQVENVVGLVELSWEEFDRGAESITPPSKGCIFVHSVGRCGSTLMSKALQSVASVHSLSEPDDLTQIIEWRGPNGLDEVTFSRLLRHSVLWRCKVRIGQPAEYVAIKPRSELMMLADLFAELFPRDHHIFLYRSATTWMRTIYRTFKNPDHVYDLEVRKKMQEYWGKVIPLIGEYAREDSPLNAVEMRILAWASCMEGYFAFIEKGVPICAVRFEDLTTRPADVIREVFDYCGIEGIDQTALQAVLDKDALAGTIYDRQERSKQQRELTDSMLEDISRIVASRPLLGSPNVVLPRTLMQA